MSDNDTSPRDVAIGAGVAIALAAAVVIAVATGTTDEKPPLADFMSDAVERHSIVEYGNEALSSTRLALLSDGGYAAYLPRAGKNGADVVLDGFPCVRRKKGSAPSSCMQKVFKDPPRDVGELNRFAVQNAVGPDCESVPCSAGGDEP